MKCLTSESKKEVYLYLSSADLQSYLALLNRSSLFDYNGPEPILKISVPYEEDTICETEVV